MVARDGATDRTEYVARTVAECALLVP